MSVDVHGQRLDVLVTRWLLRDERWECWVEGYEQLHGESSAEPGLWDSLTALVDREQPVLTAVDSGFRADPVYAWVGQDKRQRMAVKGYAGERPLLATPQRATKARQGVRTHPVPVWIVGTDAGKSRVYDLLQTDRLHIPAAPWADREFVLQLTSEHEVHAMERGHWVRRWEQVRRNNHALDLATYGLAATTANRVRDHCRGSGNVGLEAVSSTKGVNSRRGRAGHRHGTAEYGVERLRRGGRQGWNLPRPFAYRGGARMAAAFVE